MRVEVMPITPDQKPILAEMVRLYLQDIAEFSPDDVAMYGTYPYHWLDYLWTREDRHPFFIYADGQIAGFVMVAPWIMSGCRVDRALAEFYIGPDFRRKGVGSTAARMIFDMFPGTWEVAQHKENIPAQRFWHRLLHDYTGGQYLELPHGSPRWTGPIQIFRNDGKPLETCVEETKASFR